MENKVMRQFGCEDQRSSFDWQDKRRLIQTQNLGRINSSQWRQRRRSNRGQSDHQYRLWIAERRRIVETQIELILCGQRQCWNVLVLCRVRCAENAYHVYRSPDIRTVVSASRCGGGADLGE